MAEQGALRTQGTLAPGQVCCRVDEEGACGWSGEAQEAMIESGGDVAKQMLRAVAKTEHHVRNILSPNVSFEPRAVRNTGHSIACCIEVKSSCLSPHSEPDLQSSQHTHRSRTVGLRSVLAGCGQHLLRGPRDRRQRRPRSRAATRIRAMVRCTHRGRHRSPGRPTG